MNRTPIILITLFMAAIGTIAAEDKEQSLRPRATLTVETLKPTGPWTCSHGTKPPPTPSG